MKTKFTLIVALTILIIPFAYAQDLILPSPGITPDSALWGLDLAMEKIQLALTRDPAAKVQKRMEIIDERLSEEKVMAEAGNEVAFDKAELRRQLDTAEIKSDLDDKDIPENVKARVLENLQKHLTVLQGVQTNLQWRGINATGVTRAIDNANENILKFENKPTQNQLGGY